MSDKQRKPTGLPPVNRIGVYDVRGNLRGHVGRTATSATCARFLGNHSAKLTRMNGRPAWREQAKRKA